MHEFWWLQIPKVQLTTWNLKHRGSLKWTIVAAEFVFQVRICQNNGLKSIFQFLSVRVYKMRTCFFSIVSLFVVCMALFPSHSWVTHGQDKQMIRPVSDENLPVTTSVPMTRIRMWWRSLWLCQWRGLPARSEVINFTKKPVVVKPSKRASHAMAFNFSFLRLDREREIIC